MTDKRAKELGGILGGLLDLISSVHEHVFGADAIERYTHQELLDRIDDLIESENEKEA
jgi:hypothetical protein